MRYGETAWRAMERLRDPAIFRVDAVAPPIIACQACGSDHPDAPGMCSDSCPSCRADGRRHCDCEEES